MDRMLVQLEAPELAKMNRKFKKLDDTEFEIRGRRRAPKTCTTTTDLRRGTAQSNRQLLQRAVPGRFTSSLDALAE